MRAAGPVRALGIVPADHFGQELVEEFRVVPPAHARRLDRPAVADEPLLQFVVPAPERDAGVVAQAADLVLRLGADAAEERAVEGGIGRAGEHEVLPDAQAQLVAEVVKILALVNAAAPDAEHVHVGAGGAAEERLVVAQADARGEGVGGNPVGALGEEGHSVDGEPEGFAPAVLLALEFERPKADAADGVVNAGGHRHRADPPRREYSG